MSIRLLVEEGKTKTQPKYVHINEKYAKILIAILECESEEATTSKVEKTYNITSNDMTEFLSRMNEDSREFLATMEWSGGKGRPPVLLEIRPDRLVTHPLSAFILMELAAFSKEIKSREINFDHFKERLKQRISNSFSQLKDIEQKEINERLDFLISIGDIRQSENVESVIWLDLIRYHSQKAYLQLLLNKLSHQS